MALELRIAKSIDVSTGKSTEIKEIIEILKERSKLEIIKSISSDEIVNSIVPNDYLSKFLGYKDFIGLKEGIDKIWKA